MGSTLVSRETPPSFCLIGCFVSQVAYRNALRRQSVSETPLVQALAMEQCAGTLAEWATTSALQPPRGMVGGLARSASSQAPDLGSPLVVLTSPGHPRLLSPTSGRVGGDSEAALAPVVEAAGVQRLVGWGTVLLAAGVVGALLAREVPLWCPAHVTPWAVVHDRMCTWLATRLR